MSSEERFGLDVLRGREVSRDFYGQRHFGALGEPQKEKRKVAENWVISLFSQHKRSERPQPGIASLANVLRAL